MLKGKSINRIIVLLMIVVLGMVCLVGCRDKYYLEFEGVTSKKLEKDFNKLVTLIAKSASEQEYNEEDIGKLIDKINTPKYRKDLTLYEIGLIEMLNEPLEDLKNDLSTGERIVKSTTLNKMDWLIQQEKQREMNGN